MIRPAIGTRLSGHVGRPARLLCRVCGIPLPPADTRRGQVARRGICGPACLALLNGAVYGPRRCAQCGERFIPHDGRQRYCSVQCVGVKRRALRGPMGEQRYGPTIRRCCGGAYPFDVRTPTPCPRCGDTGLVKGAA